MLEREKRPTSLLTASDELRKLIIENPGVPLLVFAGGGLQHRGLLLYEL